MNKICNFLSVFVFIGLIGFYNLNAVISPESDGILVVEPKDVIAIKEVLLQETENLCLFLKTNKILTPAFQVELKKNLSSKIDPLIAACREKKGANFREKDLLLTFALAQSDAAMTLASKFGQDKKELDYRVELLNRIIKIYKHDQDKENQRFLQNYVLIGGSVFGVVLIAMFVIFGISRLQQNFNFDIEI